MRSNNVPWIRQRPSVLEPPTVSEYDRARCRSRIYFCLFAAALAAFAVCKVLDAYRDHGKNKSPQQSAAAQ